MVFGPGREFAVPGSLPIPFRSLHVNVLGKGMNAIFPPVLNNKLDPDPLL